MPSSEGAPSTRLVWCALIFATSLGLLLTPRITAAQSPEDPAARKQRELKKLSDMFDTAKKSYMDKRLSAFDDAGDARRQLIAYAKEYLEISIDGKHRGVYLYMLGLTYQWQGQVSRARTEFEKCVENGENDCLGRKCSAVCTNAAEALADQGDPFLVTQVYIDAKHGDRYFAVRPDFVSQRPERSEQKIEEIASRRALVGHFDDVRPQIDAALGARAAVASVHASDDLAVYVFGGKTAKWWHKKLTRQARDLRSWLFNADAESSSNEQLLLVVYIHLGDGGTWLAKSLHGTNSGVSECDTSTEDECTQIFYRDYEQPLGYFEPLDNSVVVLHTSTPKSLGTPRHEIVHALLREDFPGIPKWLNEGVASLHEATMSGKGPRPRPLDNWRLDYLVDDSAQRASTNLPNLTEFLDPACQNWGPHYYPIAGSMARYFVWYLFENEQLAPVYRRLRAGESRALVFEQVAGELAGAHGVEFADGEDPYAFLQGELEQFIAYRAKRAERSTKRAIVPLIDREIADGYLSSKPTCVTVDAANMEFESEAILELGKEEPQPPETPAEAEEAQPVTPPPLAEHERSGGCGCVSTRVRSPGSLAWLWLLGAVGWRRRAG